MMMVEITTIDTALLPVAELREKLRLPEGFADDGQYDPSLESCLMSAISAIEAQTGKSLFRRQFNWHLTAWGSTAKQPLPIAPVETLDAVLLLSSDGAQSPADLSRFRLQPDTHHPVLVPRSGSLPSVPTGGGVEITFTAGFGATWPEIPADMREAVLTLASHFFDRSANQREKSGTFPVDVQLLIERHRPVRLRGLK